MPGIPSQNGIALVCVSFATFIFSCCRLMYNPHSCIVNVHVVTIAHSSYVNTPFGPIFLDPVFPFRWWTRELIRMFHDLLALLRECVPLSITSIVFSNVSFGHMPFLVFEGIWFNRGANLLLCGSRVGGRFSLLATWFATYKSNMSFCLLQWTIKFMIVYLFLVPASSNLVECVFAPPRVSLFLPCK